MTYVTDPQSGRKLLCCWDDCEALGRNEIQATEGVEGGRRLTYIFCSDRHRAYWVNSHRSYGNAASGNRSPLGLYLPG